MLGLRFSITLKNKTDLFKTDCVAYSEEEIDVNENEIDGLESSKELLLIILVIPQVKTIILMKMSLIGSHKP